MVGSPVNVSSYHQPTVFFYSFQGMEFDLPVNEAYKIDRMRESIRFVSTEVRR